MKKLLITLLSFGSLTTLFASTQQRAVAADTVQKGSMSNLVRLHQTGPQGGVIQPETQGTEWKQIYPANSEKSNSKNHKNHHMLGGKGGKQQMSVSLRGLSEENRIKVIQFIQTLRKQQQVQNKKVRSKVTVAAPAA